MNLILTIIGFFLYYILAVIVMVSMGFIISSFRTMFFEGVPSGFAKFLTGIAGLAVSISFLYVLIRYWPFDKDLIERYVNSPIYF